MYTRILELKSQSHFGDDLNPLWQMCGYQNNFSSIVPCESRLIPIDTITDTITDPSRLENDHLNSRSYFQTYLNSPNLAEDFLKRTQQLGLRIQIWFDSPLEESQVKSLLSLELKNIEWVYCPRLLYHPNEIFPQSVRSLFQNLVIHLNPKMQAHDSWPDTHELWHYWLWIKNNLSIQFFQMQTFSHVLDAQSEENRFFLLNPRKKNWQIAVRSQSKFIWSLQFLSFLFYPFLKSFWFLEFSQFVSFLSYPFLKIFWFLEYQFKKRVLRRTLK